MTWVDEHPEAVEAAAKALYCDWYCDAEFNAAERWATEDNHERSLWLGAARSALAAALSAGPEPEYQWGVRYDENGKVIEMSEERARGYAKLDGWELVCWVKPGPVEVVPVETGEAQT